MLIWNEIWNTIFLLRTQILYKKPLGGGKTQYSALVNAGDMAAIEKFKEEGKKKTTSTLVNEGQVSEAVTLGGALKLRYEMRYVSSSDFDSTIKLLRNQESNYINKIVAVVSFAKDDSESVVLGKKIKNALKDGSYKMIFVDASTTPLGKDGYEQYCENMAQAMYHQGKDNNLARQYETNAKEALKQALIEYKGSILLICHEPEFYRDVVSQVWDCSKWTTKVL